MAKICTKCGFAYNEYLTSCPSCGGVTSVEPNAEFEAAIQAQKKALIKLPWLRKVGILLVVVGCGGLGIISISAFFGFMGLTIAGLALGKGTFFLLAIGTLFIFLSRVDFMSLFIRKDEGHDIH